MFDSLPHLDTMDGLDADATLALATAADAAVNRAEVAKLQAAAHWADLHSVVEGREDRRALPGCERLVRLGGDGTPDVAEFCTAELGAVLAVSDFAAGALVAAALDLRHRLPLLWSRVQAVEVPAWVGRKTAQATRHLTAETCLEVDRQLSPYADRLSWTRIEAITAATWMKADPDAAAEADRAAREARGAWVSPSTEHGTKSLFVRAEAPDVIRFDGALDRVADGLGALGDDRSKDDRRAAALGWLANPQAALDLFDQVATAAGIGLESPRRQPAKPIDTRPPVTLYVHLTDTTLAEGVGVARVEGIGPVTLDRLRTWLSHSRVSVRPVIDLADQTPVDAYEVPQRLAEAVHLISPADVFPFSSSTTRAGDIDHTIAYVPPDEGGPPGQTRIGNLAPMIRRHHRTKTFSLWTVRQVWPGVFAWRSPHGHHYLVDHTGTQSARFAA